MGPDWGPDFLIFERSEPKSLSRPSRRRKGYQNVSVIFRALSRTTAQGDGALEPEVIICVELASSFFLNLDLAIEGPNAVFALRLQEQGDE